MRNFKLIIWLVFLLLLTTLCGCQDIETPNIEESTLENELVIQEPTINTSLTPINNATTPENNIISPDSLTYLGAFRMPENGDNEKTSFAWGGEAMCFNPTNSSLFVTGHNWFTNIAEISIPAPIISKDISSLPQAKIIQPLTDVKGNLFDRLQIEIPRVGIEVIDSDLFFCWGAHYQDILGLGTHSYTSTDLSQTPFENVCLVSGLNYATNDYMFKVPKCWSDYIGYDLITGRFRDGGLGGMGPSLYAINSEDIKNAGMDATITSVALVQYKDALSGDDGAKMDNYSHADSWTGGAWIQADDKTAIVLFGTHGFGETWYGFSNGVVYPTSGDENEVYPDVPEYPYDERGWWNDDFRASLIMYNPSDFIKLNPDEVQPYAIIDLSQYLLMERDETDMHYLGSVAYDPATNNIYIQELFADEDTPIIHIFNFS